jgi:hypothetical protein
MIFVGYGDRFSVKAYRLYGPTQWKFHFAHSVYFDETSIISPQHETHPSDKKTFTPYFFPLSSKPTISTISPPQSNPQVEWDETFTFIAISPNICTPIHISIIPITPLHHTNNFSPTSAASWSLGNKTTSHLFLDPLNPNEAPNILVDQPFLCLGPNPKSHPLKASKGWSLKDIYEETKLISRVTQNPNHQYSLDVLTFEPFDTFYHHMIQTKTPNPDLYLFNLESFDDLTIHKAL